MMRVLHGIVPTSKIPRSMASTPAACGEYVRLWSDYHDAKLHDMTNITIATFCYYIGNFPTTRVQSIRDAGLLG